MVKSLVLFVFSVLLMNCSSTEQEGRFNVEDNYSNLKKLDTLYFYDSALEKYGIAKPPILGLYNENGVELEGFKSGVKYEVYPRIINYPNLEVSYVKIGKGGEYHEVNDSFKFSLSGNDSIPILVKAPYEHIVGEYQNGKVRYLKQDLMIVMGYYNVSEE